jgi:CubicO group peptidase (beta-lactamase class C family)
MNKRATAVYLGFVALVLPLYISGQELSEKFDQVFISYHQPHTPGCSLGVIRDGRFAYRKSYGAASLELGVALSPESVFYVGSISKQFTASSVILAAEQGLLSLKDDVRQYIPELPNYGHVITLREMLYQTSGFRDFFDLVYWSGHDVSQFNAPSEILRLVAQQKELNNVPGAEWIYSNTNYFLLGIVVQRATGKKLAEYAAENIFRPLGMAHTRFYDDASIVVPGRVAAYNSGQDGQFIVNWSTTYAVVGGGGLMTTVDDLLKWDDNFYANRLGNGSLVRNLATPGTLNDGKKTVYGMGLFITNYRGLPVMEHDGSLFGYRSDILRFPDQKVTIVCLCNVSDADPEGKSRKVADIYLKEKFPPESASVPADFKGQPDPAAYAGEYYDPRTHIIYSFHASDGHLQGWGSDLRRKNANQFYDRFGDRITFEKRQGALQASLDMNGETYFSGERLSEGRLDDVALGAFTGKYRGLELDSVFQLSVDHHNLVLMNHDNAPQTLTPIARDEFKAGASYLVVFHRDAHQRVSGLSIFMPAARDIRFARSN